MRVEIEGYDPGWAERFASVGARLRDVFGDGADRIDHIGSTSVHGLAAKPTVGAGTAGGRAPATHESDAPTT